VFNLKAASGVASWPSNAKQTQARQGRHPCRTCNAKPSSAIDHVLAAQETLSSEQSDYLAASAVTLLKKKAANG
jgi:hypothetical protein